MRLKVIFLRLVTLLARSQFGFLVSDLIGWVSGGKALRKPLKLSIGGLPKQLVPLTVLSTPIRSFCLKISLFYRADDSYVQLLFLGTFMTTRHCIWSFLSAQHLGLES